jgi:hypothetical protein
MASPDQNILLLTSPLQVRKGIRDAFDADDAPVKESLKKLNATTGYDMDIQICKFISYSLLCCGLILILAWVDIWNVLHPKFSDSKDTFVPSITDGELPYTRRIV